MKRALLPLVLVSLLLAGCTTGGGNNDDSDGDGVKDDAERAGRTITIQALSGPVSKQVFSDPNKADSDGDGLGDFDELLARGTDPQDVDTDGDGLLDGQDMRAPDEATAAAWRGRGIVEKDGTFLGELSQCTQPYNLKPNVESSDLPFPDKLGDGDELRGWTITVRGEERHVASDPCIADTDADGLSDDAEREALSDPSAADTDGDGTPDGQDADPLWNLGLAITNLTITTTNGTQARLLLAAGGATANATSGGSTVLELSDTSASRESLSVSVIAVAEDPATGTPVAVFPDERGAILIFDVLEGTVTTEEQADQRATRLEFTGRDGSISFDWSTSRT